MQKLEPSSFHETTARICIHKTPNFNVTGPMFHRFTTVIKRLRFCDHICPKKNELNSLAKLLTPIPLLAAYSPHKKKRRRRSPHSMNRLPRASEWRRPR